MRRLLFAAALLVSACLRPFPEMEEQDAPDAGPPPQDERSQFVPVPGAQADLRFLALTQAPDVYVSDGRSVWLRPKGQPLRQLSLQVAGQPVEEVSGLWGNLVAGEHLDAVVAGVKAGGSWSVALLRGGQVLGSRAFPGGEGPSAAAGSFSGIVLASSQTVAVFDRSSTTGGPDYALPAGSGRPSLAIESSAGSVLLFLPADQATAPRILPVAGSPLVPGEAHALATRPEARLVEAQCGLVLGGTGQNNGLVDAALLSAEQGPPARYAGEGVQGTWALLPEAFGGMGRCLGAALLSTSAGVGGETYAFAQALLLSSSQGVVRHDYKDFVASAAATQQLLAGFALAGTLTSTGQRGITFSSP